MVVLIGGIYVFSTRFTRRYGKEREQSFSDMAKVSSEALAGIKDIKIADTSGFFINLYEKIVQKNARANALNSIYQQLPKIVIETIIVTVLLGLILYSKVFLVGPEAIIASLAMYMAAAYRLMPSVNRIITSIMRLRYIEAGFKSIAPALYSALGKKSTKICDSKSIEFHQCIRFNNIHYRYPKSDVDILCGVNIEIKKGEIIGFVGESGVGKSTLFSIILGLLNETEGEKFVDNVRLNEGNIRAWQNQISYVPQHIFISDDTLVRNVALGILDSEINLEKIESSIIISQLYDFIKELPNGIHTVMGERGARLSGGQIQRIGIARALYRDKPILILDEATSALDEKTEEKLMETLNEQNKGRTILIIAHRITSLRFCDKIYQLQGNGNVQEMRYQQLINKKSV
jgi:ABC-type bacteriocin/lantibiotic exporter with double-glycine peptidase domain